MKKQPTRFRNRNLVFTCLGFLLAPFLVGFDFPDSAGTSVSAAGGHGRYRFTPTCSQYTYRSEFTEGEVSVQRRVAVAADTTKTTLGEKLKPAYVTGSLDVNVNHKDITVVESRSSSDAATGAAGADTVGSHSQYSSAALSLKLGLDWKWIGVTVGANFNSYASGETGDTRNGSGDLPGVLPVIGMRLGPENLVYLSAEALASRPLISGGTFANLGLGGKIASTRLWAGAGTAPYENPMVLAKASQQFGRTSFTATGQLPLRGSDYGFSLGLAYLLPPPR